MSLLPLFLSCAWTSVYWEYYYKYRFKFDKARSKEFTCDQLMYLNYRSDKYQNCKNTAHIEIRCMQLCGAGNVQKPQSDTPIPFHSIPFNSISIPKVINNSNCVLPGYAHIHTNILFMDISRPPWNNLLSQTAQT